MLMSLIYTLCSCEPRLLSRTAPIDFSAPQVIMATGLRKQKKYSWKETNLSLFGSDLEKKVNYNNKTLKHYIVKHVSDKRGKCSWRRCLERSRH